MNTKVSSKWKNNPNSWIFSLINLLCNFWIISIIEKIRVGRDYQAVCPPLIPEHERKLDCIVERALLVWSPTKDIPDAKRNWNLKFITFISLNVKVYFRNFHFTVEEYITVAQQKYGYNGEQALGMLFWHKHDLERAVMDLANFTPFPDEWTIEDKVLFEQAFQFHGKSFHRIRQMVKITWFVFYFCNSFWQFPTL